MRARRIPNVRIIAHRGASEDAPENTLAAFAEAMRQGCDGIELDLQLTLDGVPVVFHDRTLLRVGGGRKRVAGLPLRDLRRLDAGAWFGRRHAGLRIPTLEEVLRRYGGRTRLLLEIKIWEDLPRLTDLLRAAIREIRRFRAGPNTMILCYDFRVLAASRAIDSRIRRVLNLRAPSRPGPSLKRRLPRLSALSVDVRTLTPRFAAAVRRADRPLLAFTCNSERTVDRALAAGAAGIMTNRPGWLRRILRRRGRAQ